MQHGMLHQYSVQDLDSFEFRDVLPKCNTTNTLQPVLMWDRSVPKVYDFETDPTASHRHRTRNRPSHLTPSQMAVQRDLVGNTG